MTKVKKLLGVFLTALLCFALTPVVAFAENEGTQTEPANTGTIRIENAIDGKSYSIYKMLDLVRYNTTTNSYSYKPANDVWKTFLTSEDAKKYVDVSADGYVTWINDDSRDNVATPVDRTRAIAEFAALAIKYAEGAGISSLKTEVASDNEVIFNGLELGYYLVDSSTGAICSLATTDPAATIVEKNGTPTVEKKVFEEPEIGDASTDGYSDRNDAEIGDTVEFKTTITAQPGAVNYVLHDNMDPGLTFQPDTVKVYHGSTTLVAGTDYELITAPVHEPDPETNEVFACTFEVKLLETFSATLITDDEVVVTYSAKLNENAVVAGEGNKNKAVLSYGDNNQVHWTPESTTTTYTWEVSVFKHDEDNKGLAGAVFTLSLGTDEDSPLIYFVDKGEGIYKVVPEGTVGAITQITTDATGEFKIQGLDADTYYLTEITAPEGYNKLDAPRDFTIKQNTEGSTSDTVQGTNIIKTATVDVENKAGGLLPSTGGIGTVIFYVVGGLLVVGAVIFLVRRRSSSAK